MKNFKQERFDLPPIEEPSPWMVRIWRHLSDTDYFFVSKEDAIEFALRMEDEDCWVEGIYRGTEHDDEVTLATFPWRKA